MQVLFFFRARTLGHSNDVQNEVHSMQALPAIAHTEQTEGEKGEKAAVIASLIAR